MSTETKFERRVTQTTVVPVGEPLFSEQSTRVEIQGETDGEFVVVEQDKGQIAINPDEWPAIRDAIDDMVWRCRDAKANDGGTSA